MAILNEERPHTIMSFTLGKNKRIKDAVVMTRMSLVNSIRVDSGLNKTHSKVDVVMLSHSRIPCLK